MARLSQCLDGKLARHADHRIKRPEVTAGVGVAEYQSDSSTFALYKTLHRVHANATARNLCYCLRSGEAWRKNQLGNFFGAGLLIGLYETLFNSSFLYEGKRQPAAVISEPIIAPT